jgi:3-hydroxyisobutyrate dehydrogenase
MTVAWIGLGNMGGPMAANLVRAGHPVVGFDLSAAAINAAAAAGVTVATSVAECVADAEVVFTMLPAGAHVRTVLSGPDGILATMPAGGLVVDSSTIDIQVARELHELVAGSGFRFLDAPVSGGIFGAQAGTLTFMVGGAATDLEAVRDRIEVMAGRVFHAGGPGAGQAAKIANNMMMAVNLAGLCEGAVLADRLGLDPHVFFQIAGVSSGDSWALRTWYPMPGVVQTAGVNRDFAGGFATDLALKDVRLALAAGEATGTPLDFASLVVQRLQTMSELGYGAKDCTSLVKLIDGSVSAKDAVGPDDKH